jgi:hypothetical protein
MKRALLVGLALAIALVALAAGLPHFRARLLPPVASREEPAPQASALAPVPAPLPPPAVLRLKETGNAKLDAQIRRVVESMDRTEEPPPGIAQGGRRGSRPGVFENAERRLPARPLGYYHETDVWPRAPRRGPERLIFGRDGEVYYSPDHYRSFTRMR